MSRYSTNSDLLLLQKYASIARFGIVEIGVLDGETTNLISKVTNIPIYGIDPIVPDSMDNSLIGSKASILRNMSHYKNFYFYNEYSFNVVTNWRYKFDFIWIDGDHSYEGVKRDFDDWFPLLEIGGYLALHDVFPNVEGFKGYPGPLKLFLEIKDLNCVRVVEIDNSMPILQKIGNI